MVIQSEETKLWRVELDRETIRIPKAKGGGEWEAWVVRTFEPGSPPWVHRSDQRWAIGRYYENEVGRLRRKYGMPGEES